MLSARPPRRLSPRLPFRPSARATPKVRDLRFMAPDPAPRSNAETVVVCARAPRPSAPHPRTALRRRHAPGAPVVDQQAEGLATAAATGIGSCSACRPGGATGCASRKSTALREAARKTAAAVATIARRVSHGAPRRSSIDMVVEDAQRHRALSQHGVVEARRSKSLPSERSARARNSRIFSSPSCRRAPAPDRRVAIDLGLDGWPRQRAIVGHEGDRARLARPWRAFPCRPPAASRATFRSSATMSLAGV